MARIVITTFGSSGDLNPFIAIGLGLRALGHDVVYAVEDIFRPPLEALVFPIHRLTGDSEAALAPYQQRMFGKTTPFTSLKYIFTYYVVPTMRPKIAELRAVCADADLLLSSAVHYAASAVADLTGIPWLSVALTPSFPSAFIDPSASPVPIPTALRPLANRTSWALGNAVLRRIVDTPINSIRAEYSLPPRHNLLSTGNLSRPYTALAVSPAFFPPPPDWPTYIHTTGFCFWDEPGDWAEPPELAAFFDGAKPIVAVSSGSMAPAVRDAFDSFYRTSVAAIHRAGARALVIGASPTALPDPLPLSADTLMLPFAPFSIIYPRCAAVIHHGGIGTTGQSLRAGVPTLIVPWGADQFYNGAQLQRSGAGRWMQRRFYTVERATHALDVLLHDSSYRTAAQSIAAKIAHEDGVAGVCAGVETLLKVTQRAKV